MALTTAQKNKRKRERKKRERAAERLEQEQAAAKKAKTGFEVSESEAVKNNNNENEDVEIEYVAEPLFPSSDDAANNDGVNKEGAAADSSNAPSANGANNANANADDEDDGQDINAVMRRFQNRAAVIYVTDEDNNATTDSTSNKNDDDNLQDDENGDGNDNNLTSLSKRKLKDKLRPTVAQLKQTVLHPELVEAHDVTAPDPQFLVYLKGISGTVPVPRHWGRKRKYLQGKRGVEKPPFALPDFIIKTGICDVRDATAEDESKMS
ncbi:splicing factor 3B subunit 2, partial [bacterium]|nr:splicing factor 3B subunit 2 [bacterium]